MTDKEKNIMDQIRQKAETDTPEVPADIRPENIKARLRKTSAGRRKYISLTIAAACICALVIILAIDLPYNTSENPQVGSLTTGTTYKKIYSTLKENQDLSDSSGKKAIAAEDGSMSEESAATYQSKVSDESSKHNYSSTNIQEKDVDEGDITKYDGNYLYIVNRNTHSAENSIRIVKTADGKLNETAKIELPEDQNAKYDDISQIYIKDQKLMVIDILYPDYTKNTSDIIGNYMQTTSTRITTYDIKDPFHPRFKGKVIQSGTYSSSRMSGNQLYIFTEFTPDISQGKSSRNHYIPQINDALIEEKDIISDNDSKSTEYLVISSVDIDSPEKAADTKAVLSDNAIFYVSDHNMYIASSFDSSGSDTSAGEVLTNIIKISYKNGKLSPLAKGTVSGTLEDSFSMDEYCDNLRIVTTSSLWDPENQSVKIGGNTTYNNIFIMDKNMKKTGEVTKLAKNERIYSARFMGPVGYFVTFRETDPLFSADLSDPKRPKIIGELKLPGFSDYLHFYGKNTLLGIGKEADNISSGDVKLSMFDIQDPSDVKEKDKYVIKGSFDSPALSDHKSIMIDQDKNIFGFAVSAIQGTDYCLFTYTGHGFKKLGSIPLSGGDERTRGFYSGNYFYLCQNDLSVQSFKLDTLKKVQDIVL